jgi:hypothetical protein
MTKVSEEVFLFKLQEVVYKLATIANTQGSRFIIKWNEYLAPINVKPPIIQQIKIDKDKFIKNIDYRISVLKSIENSFVEGFQVIKSFLEMLYKSYFNNSKLFRKDFSEKDQIILKYYAAKEVLGSLIQYNQIDHETVDLKYNIIARNYLLIKMKGLNDSEIIENMKKLNIELDIANLHKIMDEIETDGIIKITDKGDNHFYELAKELELSDKGKLIYNRTLRPLIEWPIEFWRSFYNIRELNVTLEEKTPQRELLEKILVSSALQGFTAADYVFKNLITYYEKVKGKSN